MKKYNHILLKFLQFIYKNNYEKVVIFCMLLLPLTILLTMISLYCMPLLFISVLMVSCTYLPVSVSFNDTVKSDYITINRFKPIIKIASGYRLKITDTEYVELLGFSCNNYYVNFYGLNVDYDIIFSRDVSKDLFDMIKQRYDAVDNTDLDSLLESATKN